MTSKSNFHQANNLLRRASAAQNGLSERLHGLQAMGSLSSINTQYNRPFNPQPSIDYLNQASFQPGMSRNQAEPPPLPPRPDQTTGSGYMRSPGMRNYYNPYSAYSGGLYSPGFRGFNTYGRLGPSHDPYNSFVQLAEESSRPTFETIESVVEVFSSISMMLESTYHAVHSSYSAILGVVDQFSRLKDHLAEILSILTLLRSLRWLCFKVLYLLRLRKENPSVEAAWRSAQTTARDGSSSLSNEPRTSSWPFFVFLGLVVGAPWLMFKLLARTAKKSFDEREWVSEDGKYFLGRALYDFRSTRPKELSLKAGEKLYLSPQGFSQNRVQSWVLACNAAKQIGLVPSNYIRITIAKLKAPPVGQNDSVSANPVMRSEDLPLSNNSLVGDLPDEISSFKTSPEDLSNEISSLKKASPEDLSNENSSLLPEASVELMSNVPCQADASSVDASEIEDSPEAKSETVNIVKEDV